MRRATELLWLAAPRTVERDGRFFILTPVSLRGWATVEDLWVRGGAAETSNAILYALWLGLQEHQPQLTLGRLGKFFRRRPVLLMELFSALLDISMPPSAAPPDPCDTIEKLAACKGEHLKNLRRLCSHFSSSYGWTPRDIGNMTPAQIDLWAQIARKQTGGRKVGSLQEARAILHPHKD